MKFTPIHTPCKDDDISSCEIDEGLPGRGEQDDQELPGQPLRSRARRGHQVILYPFFFSYK